MSENKFEIICVDDEVDILDINAEILNDLGYITRKFTSPAEAISYISENPKKIAMILSDLRMDNINGFEFKKQLPKNTSDIPFVVITGYWTKEMSSKAMEIGIKAFIEKPVTADVLGEMVEKFAAQRAELLNDELEMIQGFLEESEPMLEEIENLILEVEEEPDSEKALAVYFRLLHTIKGTASCVGLINLGNYTHKYEDFIGLMRENKVPVCTESINILLKGLDDLKLFFTKTNELLDDSFIDIEATTKIYTENLDFSKKSAVKDTTVAEVKTEEKTKEKDDEKMTVAMSILNEFMEESGELTVIRNSILKTVKKIENKFRGDDDINQLNDLLEGMYNVTSDIQEKIEQMRRVPLKNTFRPFKRLVRDLSKKLGKEVELEIEGEELLVDTTIAKLFSNTLIHLVRNSLDHGLETPEKRQEKGKDRVGHLKISVVENGENIELKIIDDGNGINPDIIRSKSLEKGLYTEAELDQMSELEIVNIVFESGFSTAEVVSDLSGRGVGMDMVRGSFEEMGGVVFVKSEFCKGSTFHLNVPVPKSVLIINSLLVKCCKQTFIFHMDEVSEVIRYEKESANSKMYEFVGERLLSHNGESIEILALQDVLGLEAQREKKEVVNLVVLRVGNYKFAVEVDEIHEFEEVVSRKISPQISSSDLYLGASLLGSGEVAMIISAEGIVGRTELNVEGPSGSKSHMMDFIFGEQKINAQGKEYMLFKYHPEKTALCIELDQVERFEKIQSSSIEFTGDNMVLRYFNSVLELVDPGQILNFDSTFDQEVVQQDISMEIMVVKLSEDRRVGFIVSELGEIKYTEQTLNTDTIDMIGLRGSLFIDEKTITVIDPDAIYQLHKNRFLEIELSDESDYYEEAA